MSKHNKYKYNRYSNYNSYSTKRTGNKLFSVSTSPAKPNGTFSATFTGLVNYTDGGIITGTWDFGDGQTIKYLNDKPFTHHGYFANKNYTVTLKIIESYRRNINTTSEKTEKYYKIKTIQIGASGKQLNATFIQF